MRRHFLAVVLIAVCVSGLAASRAGAALSPRSRVHGALHFINFDGVDTHLLMSVQCKPPARLGNCQSRPLPVIGSLTGTVRVFTANADYVVDPICISFSSIGGAELARLEGFAIDEGVVIGFASIGLIDFGDDDGAHVSLGPVPELPRPAPGQTCRNPIHGGVTSGAITSGNIVITER